VCQPDLAPGWRGRSCPTPSVGLRVLLCVRPGDRAVVGGCVAEPVASSVAGPVVRSLPLGFAAGAVIGVLGGMIGLGGAEFRLPLLIGVFGFVALQAVILNKTMSLVVVATALPARLAAVPFSDVTAQWTIILNLLAGSLVGAWAGATWATKMRSATLYKVLAALLVVIAAALVASHLGPVAALDPVIDDTDVSWAAAAWARHTLVGRLATTVDDNCPPAKPPRRAHPRRHQRRPMRPRGPGERSAYGAT